MRKLLSNLCWIWIIFHHSGFVNQESEVIEKSLTCPCGNLITTRTADGSEAWGSPGISLARSTFCCLTKATLVMFLKVRSWKLTQMIKINGQCNILPIQFFLPLPLPGPLHLVLPSLLLLLTFNSFRDDTITCVSLLLFIASVTNYKPTPCLSISSPHNLF